MMDGLRLDILLPLLLVPLAAAGGFVLYRRAMTRLGPDAERREVSGVRVTSERLRRLPSPPWRVVYEIAPGRIGDVDHVVVGPPGVIAITTVTADRPADDITIDPTLVVATATMRGAVDDLTRPAGAPCDVLAKVFWGTPQPDRPIAHEITHGGVAVEGQRLDAWLESLPAGALPADGVDRAWRAVVTGIGRPDPLG